MMRTGDFHIPSLNDVEKCDAVLILGDDPMVAAPMLGLAILQSLRNQSYEIAAKAGIPDWNDAAVRDIAHNVYNPLFLATHSPSMLDDKARKIFRGENENIAKFGLPVVVALNRFETDTDAEIELVRRICAEAGVEMAVSELFAKGGDGGLELAEKVVKACEMPNQFHYLYTNEMSIRKKIETIATEIYGASGVQYDDVAKSAIKAIEALDPINSTYPVCMAKTQYSLSDNPALIGRPTDYNINIRDVRLSAGARFIVVLTGAVMTMPGLPKKPAANIIDIDDDGNISGLF
jgi:formate--tetrahydrofolate ligase